MSATLNCPSPVSGAAIFHTTTPRSAATSQSPSAPPYPAVFATALRAESAVFPEAPRYDKSILSRSEAAINQDSPRPAKSRLRATNRATA